MAVGQHTGVVKEGAEITARHVLHGKIDALVVLEGVEQPYKPFALGGSKNVSFGEDMTDFVQLEEQLFAHDLEGADFSRVLLLGQKHLAVTSLADLRQDLEVTMSETNSSLSKVCALSTSVLGPHLSMGLLVGIGRRGELVLEGIQSVLSRADIGEEVEVVVQEICKISVSILYIVT